MTQEKSDSEPGSDLLQAVLARSFISQAQADLVKRDSENTGMSIEEVLLARRWITEEQLSELQGGQKNSEASNAAAATKKQVVDRVSGGIIQMGGSSDDYGENLARYRSIMRDVLGNEQ
ncbi:MAG: hypothetical protein K2Y32_11220 [Candidatus Obscuribacterales bacterium]|nr:hypothetical protein [Candidatus Obscuribacterales bacterium]